MAESFFEILKYTIPALIVFATSYFLLKQYLTNQYDLRALEVKSKYSKDAIPLKLQAYERLLLFCERISIPNLLLRLKTRDMSVTELKNAMVISVQKEFEHNMAQQLYTSQKLWDILSLAKNDIISMVTNEANKHNGNENAEALAKGLMTQLSTMNKSPLNIAIQGIKEEAKIILKV